MMGAARHPLRYLFHKDEYARQCKIPRGLSRTSVVAGLPPPGKERVQAAQYETGCGVAQVCTSRFPLVSG